MSANPNTLRRGPVAVAQKSESSAACDRVSGESSGREGLQFLLAFSAMHDQVRRSVAKTVEISQFSSVDAEQEESFALDEVLHLVAERAAEVTEADGIAVALADENGVAVRAGAGSIRPDLGQSIDMEASFSSTCFRTGQLLICQDSEADGRVNRSACASLGARSLLAVPIRGLGAVIGILEAFSKDVSGFNDKDARQLSLLAELVAAALSSDERERVAKSAQAVAEKLQPTPPLPKKPVANSMWRSFLSEPAASSEASGNEEFPHRVALHVASAPKVREGSPAAKAEVGAAVAVRPQPETQERYRFGTAFLTWFVVIAAGLVLAFGWRIGTSPRLSAVGVAVDKSHSASLASPGPPSIAPARRVEPGAAPKIESKTGALVGENFSRVTGIHVSSRPGATTVVIACDAPVQYKAHRLPDPERIFFDLANARLARDLSRVPIRVEDGTLIRIRAAQMEPGVTRVVLETEGRANYSVIRDAGGPGLRIEVGKGNSTQH